jgi:plasmid maintenance system killer protein
MKIYDTHSIRIYSIKDSIMFNKLLYFYKSKNINIKEGDTKGWYSVYIDNFDLIRNYNYGKFHWQSANIIRFYKYIKSFDIKLFEQIIIKLHEIKAK